MQAEITIPKRDPEHERVLGIVYDISPAQAAVLSCLCRGTVVTGDELMAFSGIKPPVKVVISRTRAKMKEHGMDIRSKINVGYWMDAEDRQDIQRSVDDFLAGR